MKIISFIEEQAVIKQILQHIGLWDIRNTGPPPRTDLNIVRELAYQVAPDQAPPDLMMASFLKSQIMVTGLNNPKILQPVDTVELSRKSRVFLCSRMF